MEKQTQKKKKTLKTQTKRKQQLQQRHRILLLSLKICYKTEPEMETLITLPFISELYKWTQIRDLSYYTITSIYKESQRCTRVEGLN